MKNIAIALTIIASIAPVSMSAQSNSVTVNRESLLQLITSLQKQIVILTEQLAQKEKNVTDRCPNIKGVQVKVPEDMSYVRSYDKCLTKRERDRLEEKVDKEESEESACEESEDKLSDLREDYINADDKIEAIKSSIPKESKGTSMLLTNKDVSPFLEWIKAHYTPTGKVTRNQIEYVTDFPTIGNFNTAPIGEMRPSNGGCRESGCSYSDKLIQLALKISLLELEQKEINTRIQSAEIETYNDCD